MDFKEFINRVLRWKLAGAAVWAFIPNYLFYIIVRFTRLLYITKPLFWLGYFVSIPVMSIYMKTLSTVPAKTSVLSIKETSWRLLFATAHLIWIFITGCSVLEYRYAAVFSLIVTFVIYNTNNFIFIFSDLVSNQKYRRFSTVVQNFSFPMIPIVLFGSICAYFMQAKISQVLLSSFYLFSLSSLTLTITAVVTSERTSFNTQRHDGERILNGFNSTDIGHFLAFKDLEAISGGYMNRRDQIFSDASGQYIKNIVTMCTEVIRSYSEQHLLLQAYGSDAPAAPMVSKTAWRRSLPGSVVESKAPFFTRRVENANRLRREHFALKNSILVQYSVRVLVNFAQSTQSQDALGVYQTQMDNIMQSLVDAQAVLERSRAYVWSTPRYYKWIAKSPAQLTEMTLHALSFGIKQFVRFGVKVPKPRTGLDHQR